MTDAQLHEWVKQISLSSFNLPFQHQASFNHRLRSTGGRYFTHTHNIEISWRQFEKHGKEEIEKIIKHELCHYHLHLLNKGYKHRDADFRTLLKQVGGSRFCKPVSDPKKRVQPFRFKLECSACRQEYFRKRKVNIKKYACGRCGGRLNMFPLDFKKDS
jgi:SprT-like protein